MNVDFLLKNINKISTLRRKKGWTIKQLQNKSNVNRYYLDKFEAGDTKLLTQERAELIAKALGVSVNDII